MAGHTLRTIDYSVLQQCMHCGMCLPACPTYDATKQERNSPRGRIALMRAVADGDLEVTRTFAEEMSYCLGCLACQTACPAGVNYAELFETARSDIEIQGAHPGTTRGLWRALTLGFLFLHPRLFRAMGRVLRVYQRSGLEALVRRHGLLRLLPADLRRLEPQTPRIGAAFSNALIAPREEPRATARYRVALLTGCIQDLVFAEVNRDTADVLLANGCAVETPPVQPCCGSLHAHNGDLDGARTLARRLIDLLPPDRYDAIISNAGGCGSHLRRYGPLLHDDPAYRDRAAAWDAKLRDIHEWLAEIDCRRPFDGAQGGPFDGAQGGPFDGAQGRPFDGAQGGPFDGAQGRPFDSVDGTPVDEPVTVTYHESCHLVHGQKISRQPRALLRLLPGVSLVELPESSWCCGSAGVYAITQPDQAELLLARKTAHVLETGAQILATANPGCHLQIARGLTAAGAAVQVVHPITLLARAYRRERS